MRRTNSGPRESGVEAIATGKYRGLLRGVIYPVASITSGVTP